MLGIGGVHEFCPSFVEFSCNQELDRRHARRTAGFESNRRSLTMVEVDAWPNSEENGWFSS